MKKQITALAALALYLLSGFSHAGEWSDKNFVKPPPEQLKKTLSEKQFNVTQKADTEQAFHNEFFDNHQPGIYVDVVTGEPLFSSLDKYDSGTGWPSFKAPIQGGHVVESQDPDHERTEVHSRLGQSHLGHVFDDGPTPTNKRFCINSAALKFIPLSEMKKAGYGRYLPAFHKAGEK